MTFNDISISVHYHKAKSCSKLIVKCTLLNTVRTIAGMPGHQGRFVSKRGHAPMSNSLWRKNKPSFPVSDLVPFGLESIHTLRNFRQGRDAEPLT